MGRRRTFGGDLHSNRVLADMVTRTLAAAVAFVALGATRGLAQNICADPNILNGLERSRQIPNPPPVLYDGRKALKRPPVRQIRYPFEVTNGDACVALYIKFVETAGTLYLDDVGFTAAAGPGLGIRRRQAALVQAATQVLREVVQQDLLPDRPAVGKPYIVLVPMWQSHPIFGSASAPAPVVALAPTRTLLDRGFRDAKYLGSSDGADVFILAERQNRYWFAVVRGVRTDEPILAFDGPVGNTGNAQLSATIRRRFERSILPHVRETEATMVTVEIRHFATGTHVRYRPDSPFDFNMDSFHPLIGDTVEVPIAVERWQGNRPSRIGPYTWTTTGAWGTRPSAYNTIAAIQRVQDSVGARLAGYAAVREARDVKERDAVRQGRLRVAAREAAKPAAYAAKGLAYREPSFWSRFQAGHLMRRVFEGHYPDANRDWRFGRLYFRAVTVYGDSCRTLLPPGAPMRITTRFQEDFFGRERLTGADTIFIHPNYQRVFKGWFDGRLDVPATNPPEVTPAGAIRNPAEALRVGFVLTQLKETLKNDFATFFGEGCRSPTVRQLMENLRRLGERERTLQEELVPATLPSPDDPPTTIGEACQKYDRDNGARPSGGWCDCLDRVVTPRYPAAELPRLLENYSALIERLSFPPPGDDRNNLSREYHAADACR